MKAGQLMKQRVMTCDASDSLEAAARIMWENDCGCVPVRDSDGRVGGMITDRDVCMAAYLQGGPLRTLYVGSAMARGVHSCTPESTIAECEAIMRQHQVRRLPVVDGDGRLVGILSMSDIGREARHETGHKKGEVTLTQVGETLKAVSMPRRTASAA